jgi:hypothetical protein
MKSTREPVVHDDPRAPDVLQIAWESRYKSICSGEKMFSPVLQPGAVRCKYHRSLALPNPPNTGT